MLPNVAEICKWISSTQLSTKLQKSAAHPYWKSNLVQFIVAIARPLMYTNRVLWELLDAFAIGVAVIECFRRMFSVAGCFVSSLVPTLICKWAGRRFPTKTEIPHSVQDGHTGLMSVRFVKMTFSPHWVMKSNTQRCKYYPSSKLMLSLNFRWVSWWILRWPTCQCQHSPVHLSIS